MLFGAKAGADASERLKYPSPPWYEAHENVWPLFAYLCFERVEMGNL
jgi:hypothetical protein